jgi:hypothetical protein
MTLSSLNMPEVVEGRAPTAPPDFMAGVQAGQARLNTEEGFRAA